MEAAPRDDEARRAALKEELNELEDRAKFSAQGQFEQSKFWQRLNLGAGIATAVAAAVSGALVLAEAAFGFIGGMLALAAAAGGAVLTTSNAAQRASKAASTANSYLEIQNAIRRTRNIDLACSDLDDMRQVLETLSERMDEQNKTAEPIAAFAYRRARRNIAAGGQSRTES